MARKKQKKSEDKELAGLEKALANIEKRFGKEAITKCSGKKIAKIDVIPTGSFGLDLALGVGGIPLGRVSELYGPESSGKSTVTLHIIAQAQKLGYKCGLIDSENAFDPEYAKSLGVDLDTLLISQPDYGEQGLDIVEELIRSGEIKLIVIDSVAALSPKAEIEGEMGDSVPGELPVLIRRDGKYISIVSIESLYGGTIGENSTGKIFRYKKLKKLEIMTHEGWKKIHAVVKKKNIDKKPLVVTKTISGLTITTPDHSLFKNGKAITPTSLKINDQLDYSKIKYDSQLNGFNDEIAWLVGYFCAEGSKHSEVKNCFSLVDTTIQNIDKAIKILSNNFTCHITKSVQTKFGKMAKNRKPLNRLYISGDPILTKMLEQCYDKKTKLKRIPDFILNSCKNSKLSFLSGYRDGDGDTSKDLFSFSSSSLLMIAGIELIFNSLGFKSLIDIHPNKIMGEYKCNPNYNIRQVTKHIKKENSITKFINLDPPEWLFDIETESGTFVGGAGRILHHNSHMGLQARMMSQALRKITAIANKQKCAVIFINQIRMKIGVMFGNPETTTGGNALKYYASVRIDTRIIEKIKDGDDFMGVKVRAKVVKNKVAPPFKKAEFMILFGKGIDPYTEILDIALSYNVLKKSGTWWSYNEDRMGAGQEKAAQFLRENHDIYAKIVKDLKKKIKESNND